MSDNAIAEVIERLEEDITFTLLRPLSPSEYRAGKIDGIRLAISYLREAQS